MKKTLISLTIVLVLIGGFVVGQSQLKTTLRTQGNNNMDYSSNGGAFASESSARSSGSENYSSPQNDDSKNTSGNTAVEGCDYLSDCGPITMPNPDPTGDPLSKFIVKTGNVTITITKNSLSDKYDKLVTMIKESGGYLEQDSSQEHSSTITVRIPADKLDETLVSLRKLGKIKSQSLNSNDQAFTIKDYEARLKVLTQRKDVLSASLANAKPTDTQYIQEQLFQLQSEIESVTGQQSLVNDQIAMSTLTITIDEKGTKEVADDNTQSLIAKSWEKASNSFLTSIGGILIVFAAIFPFLIVALIVYKLVRQGISTRKAKKVKENK